MPKRTSVNDVKQLEDLDNLHEIVKDKRNDKRASAKKERRNRHYVKLLIKQQIKGLEDEDYDS
ncbi:hypothetical protein [Penaeicola halotolerans]|uniref:hypothetical protein n=1 Tax=Penaeicola halotolerans TaxID=2793196 RepID=UPI001CF83FD9|nr:hypothetical protein [Penaeicola halotolerans]